MAVLALIAAVPLLLYCVAQTIRDVRRRSWPFAVYGLAMLVLMIWVTGLILAAPGY
jgi:predicted membrane channel-forming protein YqfA (hemolysin III family)